MVGHSGTFRRGSAAACAVAVCLGAHGVAQAQAAQQPIDVLKQCMARYAGFTSFQADCDVRVFPRGENAAVGGARRQVRYVRPNRFKVVSESSLWVATSVSDGVTLTEFNTFNGVPVMEYTAPASIADAGSVNMTTAALNGSPLYAFFGGSAKLDALIERTHTRVTFGKRVTLDGQSCRTVRFWARGSYGSTEVAIGMDDGLVHGIAFLSEPEDAELRRFAVRRGGAPQRTRNPLSSANRRAKGRRAEATISWRITETYRNIVVDKPIDKAVFVAAPPSGVPVEHMGSGSTRQLESRTPHPTEPRHDSGKP